MKKLISLLSAALMLTALLAACSSTSSSTSSSSTTSNSVSDSSPASQNDSSDDDNNDSFNQSRNITVISRENGSGTRGAFIELFGIEEKQDDGTKLDTTTLDAVVNNSTSVMMTTVANDPYAIGYISLGSLNDSVKALEIDGAAPSVENIKNDTYKVARPFNIATMGAVDGLAADFISFILSSEGQAVIEENSYISVDGATPYEGTKPEGKIVVAGSSSVTPVMEKLKEAYVEINPNAEIEIQQSDSSGGLNAAVDGICDIAMASRELKDSELEAGLEPTVIAIDGIAVIVNSQNSFKGLTSEQVKSIYNGTATIWQDVQ